MHDIYTDRTYLTQNPTWHEEDSPRKARQIQIMLEKHPLNVRSVAEIGCGAGAILGRLRQSLPGAIEFSGFDIAPDAIARAKALEDDRLHFYQEDLLLKDCKFDLLLIMDVIEHVPDFVGFLEGCRRKAKFKLYHIPLDIHVSSVMRKSFLSSRLKLGHIHYFTAETALAALADTGHKVVDWFYTAGSLDLESLHSSPKKRLANLPRRLVSLFSTAWSARLLGSYSLMVLTE